MEYKEITFSIAPNSEVTRDVLAAVCAEIGFDSFQETRSGLKAYIQTKLFCVHALDHTVNSYPIPSVAIRYQVTDAENKDWNAEWERNSFQPIVLSDKCVVHGPFHTNIPDAKYPIIINPRMAFGTGTHATTRLLLNYLLEDDLIVGKDVLDMGCGTAILSILAALRGANAITAIDNDEWSVDNARENLKLNSIPNVDVLLGDATTLQSPEHRRRYQMVLANINRNILLNDMERYLAAMQPRATLYMSGFYLSDLPLLQNKAQTLGLQFLDCRTEDDWTAARFTAI